MQHTYLQYHGVGGEIGARPLLVEAIKRALLYYSKLIKRTYITKDPLEYESRNNLSKYSELCQKI